MDMSFIELLKNAIIATIIIFIVAAPFAYINTRSESSCKKNHDEHCNCGNTHTYVLWDGDKKWGGYFNKEELK